MNVVGIVGMWAGARRHGSRCFCDDQIESNRKFPGPEEVILCWAEDAITDPPEEPGITFMGRENNSGWSYGSWCHAALQRPDADAFILWEDDYIPCLDGYAQKLIDLWSPGDYVATLVWENWREFDRIAALAHGIIDGKVLRSMAEEYLSLDLEDAEAQKTFSSMSEKHGARLIGMQEEYSSVYYNAQDQHILYGKGPLVFRSLWQTVKENQEGV